MKKIILVFLLYVVSTVAYCQKKASKEYTTTHVETIDFSKLYDKKTGEKISENEFINLMGNEKNIILEREIGVDGKVTRYLVDLSSVQKIMKPDKSNFVDKGESFPNFILNTVSNERIELFKFKGKLVIIRFELEASTHRFNKYEISQLDSRINQIEDKENKVEAIIIFASTLSDVKQGFDLDESNFSLIANGRNIHQRFSITRFPTTVVLDKMGKVIDYYYDLDELDLKKLVSE